MTIETMHTLVVYGQTFAMSQSMDTPMPKARPSMGYLTTTEP